MGRTKKTASAGAVSGEVMPPTPRINLASPEYIRQEMARVYREARGKLIDTNEASKLIYMLSQIERREGEQDVDFRLRAAKTFNRAYSGPCVEAVDGDEDI